jgi:hypothetical protein
MSKVFHMLYVLDGAKPNQPYLTFDGAVARAKVLARETRKPVMILTSTHEVTAEVPDVEPTYNVEVL